MNYAQYVVLFPKLNVIQKLLEGGALEVLSELTTHDNSTIQLNALWALMVGMRQNARIICMYEVC